MNRHLERDIQRSCIRWMRQVFPPGSIVASVTNEQRGASADPMARARYGQARKASGVVTGFPDCIAVLPQRVVFVEFKAPGGVVSVEQQHTLTALRELGHTAIIADSLESLRGALLAAGIPLREGKDQPIATPKVRFKKSKLPDDRVPF